jgi:hypothetical protein
MAGPAQVDTQLAKYGRVFRVRGQL